MNSDCQDDIKELVQYRINQADESLHAARLMIGQQLYQSVINRAYYAMFYVVLALLSMRGKSASKHAGAISLFDIDFVRPGTFSKQFSQWLHEAFDLRQKSDYEEMFMPSTKEATTTIEPPEVSVSSVKIYLLSMGS